MPPQTELQSLVVRPIEPEEETRWKQLMDEHHYLGFCQLVGESMKYVAELNGQWVALLGWETAAFKCGPRDEWIGWSREQQWRRLIREAQAIERSAQAPRDPPFRHIDIGNCRMCGIIGCP